MEKHCFVDASTKQLLPQKFISEPNIYTTIDNRRHLYEQQFARKRNAASKHNQEGKQMKTLLKYGESSLHTTTTPLSKTRSSFEGNFFSDCAKSP